MADRIPPKNNFDIVENMMTGGMYTRCAVLNVLECELSLCYKRDMVRFYDAGW